MAEITTLAKPSSLAATLPNRVFRLRKQAGSKLHKFVITDEANLTTVFHLYNSMSALVVDNISLTQLKLEVKDALTQISKYSKQQKVIIIYACGFSRVLTRYSASKPAKARKCCLKCELYLATPAINDLYQNMLCIKEHVSSVIPNCLFIPTSLPPFSIKWHLIQFHADHQECCTHALADVSMSKIGKQNLESMQKLVDGQLQKYNESVVSYCITETIPYVDWTKTYLTNTDIKQRQEIIVKKINSILKDFIFHLFEEECRLELDELKRGERHGIEGLVKEEAMDIDAPVTAHLPVLEIVPKPGTSGYSNNLINNSEFYSCLEVDTFNSNEKDNGIDSYMTVTEDGSFHSCSSSITKPASSPSFPVVENEENSAGIVFAKDSEPSTSTFSTALMDINSNGRQNDVSTEEKTNDFELQTNANNSEEQLPQNGSFRTVSTEESSILTKEIISENTVINSNDNAMEIPQILNLEKESDEDIFVLPLLIDLDENDKSDVQIIDVDSPQKSNDIIYISNSTANGKGVTLTPKKRLFNKHSSDTKLSSGKRKKTSLLPDSKTVNSLKNVTVNLDDDSLIESGVCVQSSSNTIIENVNERATSPISQGMKISAPRKPNDPQFKFRSSAKASKETRNQSFNETTSNTATSSVTDDCDEASLPKLKERRSSGSNISTADSPVPSQDSNDMIPIDVTFRLPKRSRKIKHRDR